MISLLPGRRAWTISHPKHFFSPPLWLNHRSPLEKRTSMTWFHGQFYLCCVVLLEIKFVAFILLFGQISISKFWKNSYGICSSVFVCSCCIVATIPLMRSLISLFVILFFTCLLNAIFDFVVENLFKYFSLFCASVAELFLEVWCKNVNSFVMDMLLKSDRNQRILLHYHIYDH